jgi:hypothetical protein
MSNKKTGGPAFPTPRYERGDMYSLGMTLRDYFAAHSPITLTDAVEFLDTYGGEVTGPWPPKEVLRTLADLRIEYANAMLKARDE